RVGAHGEMHLAHREIVETEGKLGCREGVWLLFVRQRDVEADGWRSGFGCAAIGRRHDARATASGDDVVAEGPVRDEGAAPFRDDAADSPRLVIPARMLAGA